MAEYIDRSELLRIEKLLDTDILRKSKTADCHNEYEVTHWMPLPEPPGGSDEHA